jgi:hypothetical protein
VTTELDFGFGRKPTQIVSTLCFGNEKGSFGKIVLVGDLLHQTISEPGIERYDCSRIALEWLGRKCIDLPEFQFHHVRLR